MIDQIIDTVVTVLLLAGFYGFYAAQGFFILLAAWAAARVLLRIGFGDW
jgi:hypothetical protein